MPLVSDPSEYNIEYGRFIEATSSLGALWGAHVRLRGPVFKTLRASSFAVFLSAWILVFPGSGPSASSSVAQAQESQSVPESGTESAYFGLPVESIQFPDVPPGPEQNRLRQLVVQPVGEALDRERIRQTIQVLHDTGRFADLRVEAERTGSGQIALSIFTQPTFFVGQVSVIGSPAHPTETQLANASKFQLGEPYTAEKLARALKNIQQLMQENGFHRSSVAAEEKRHPETQQIDIVFQLSAGPQAHVGTVEVTGNPGLSPGEIRDIAKMHPGDAVSSQRVSNALARLRKKYQKQNRWLAQVSIAKSAYQQVSNAVDYTIDIQPGPLVDIQTEGFKISRSVLKKNVPVYEERALDTDLLNEGRRNLLNYMQSRGYFDAQVDLRRRGARTDQMRVLYVINPGDRHKLGRIDIKGNKTFSEELLRTRMQVQPAGRLFSQGRYSQSLLNDDIRSLEQNPYRDNGFLDVKITADVQDNYQGKKDNLALVLNVEEGPQTLVKAVRISGDAHLPQEELQKLNTSPGQAYSESNIAEDRELILNYYYNHGFPDATFEASAKPSPDDPKRMDVEFTVHEGEQVFVEQVLVSGLHFTRPFVVDRELQMKPGDPLSQIDMLATQQHLYDLGIFSQVDTAIQNAEGKEKDKTLLVQVQEAKRYTFNYGVGFEFQTGQPSVGTNQPQGQTGVSPRVSFSVTRLNFRGRNHTLTFKTNVGRLQQRALVNAEVPRWFSSPDWKLSFTAFYDNTVDVTTFTSQRLEGSAQAQETISRASTIVYNFTYRRVKASNLAVNINEIPLLSQPVRVGMPGFTYLRNTRDNDLETTKGTYTTIDAGVASTYFGSQVDFSRILLQNSTYHAFGKNRTAERKYVLARSTRIGLENPFGGTVTPAPGLTPPAGTSVIPLPELFLSGGGNSHRGFGLNQAGPRDPVSGFPLGGSALFLNNLELRFPPVTLPFVQDNMSFAIFHDAGNVFTNGHNMLHSLVHWKQPTPALCEQQSTANQCNYNYISHAIGIGVRYKTPIGPVRFDFGYNLNPPKFPSVQNNVFIPQQARHFNVFFSIGQTF